MRPARADPAGFDGARFRRGSARVLLMGLARLSTMPIHVALNHVTAYRYDREVMLGPQVVRLRPAAHCRTPVLAYSLKVEPEGGFINWQQDPHGNHLARLVFPRPTRSFSVEVDLVAEMAVYNPFDFFLEPGAERFPFAYEPALAKELSPFLPREPLGHQPALARLLAGIDLKEAPTVDFLVGINRRINGLVRYIIRLEPGVQTPEETLVKGSGSCRDSAWLLVRVLRHLGLAARFVSGYLIQLRADERPIEGPAGTERDFTDLHAWCEVYLPGAGWIGLDPTSGLLAGEGHIPLACSPEPSSSAPVSGAVGKCEVEFDFRMSVSRLRESPRVTRPFSETQWSRIDALGATVDERLREGDVRLTMGGEPTFISIDDMEGAEWNSAALGPRKRELAGDLLRRLWRKFGRGGFLHHGQGKWYPGESLPRWALSVVWRRDGQPVWRREDLLADPDVPAARTVDDAERFARSLCGRLGITDQWVLPAREDAWYYLWKERRLPANVDPLRSNLRDPEERQRLARVFEQGLDAVTGFALPLAATGSEGWSTGPWFLRPEALFLIPGDSPMGFRLPLDSQPWVAPADAPLIEPPDPQVPREPLPGAEALARQARLVRSPSVPDGPAPDRQPAARESASWIVRTALCVEPRGGHLHVFLPPLRTVESYLALLAAVEATAADLTLPVVLEGYLPPPDERLDSIRVTPDPGVIEVNIHPSSSWAELREKNEFLHQAARESRLGTEKFMVDGRHTGTGGGSHLILGGERPSDSPLLRRPHLLASLIAYWHNHPSLSYLFSGLFIGPTSQAPRLDEARNDSLYEMEIAFGELGRQLGRGSPVAPWLVDRIFRNLLTDVSGNTHRAEFCIDKLYAPEGATGRLGLLELRAFEMPPHPRMGLLQQLLVRALVARFWDHPCGLQRLARWGTDLHDRFVLPHHCRRDLADVVADLRSWGMPFEEEWFDAHFEFRFPRIGQICRDGVEIELRHALEPWHVMGEEGAAGGAVRYVDSSLERLQVKVAGLMPDRHLVTCNGWRVPLHPTGVNGEQVAGVRYRAWQPPACLHPTIGVDGPLVFDLIDGWNDRSIGGCTYHVVHPGGRNYSTFPVNSYEAESRRLARFFPHGHTPGHRLPAAKPLLAPEFPHTLDLRGPWRERRS